MLLNFLRGRLESHRAEKRYVETAGDWQAMRARVPKRPLITGAPQRLVIVPSDPWTLTGAKGDEAMIQAVVSQLKAVTPGLKVAIITGSEVASQAARQLGYEPLQVWRQKLETILSAIESFKADGLAVLGADCMDGYYSADTTLCLVAIADMASRLGMRTTVLGFSFNEQPATRLATAFNDIDERVSINVRDEISLQRFNRFCSKKARLVTDSAFMLQPITDSAPVQELAAWASAQKSKGRSVLGFNVHPMLIKNPASEQLQALTDNVCKALTTFLQEADVAIALISHDYRGSSGDDTCLKPLYARLSPSFSDRLYYRDWPVSAAELKGMAGLLDGVVTGRMHLAIASLGMGTPVAALTYQDKFQGLMKHLNLPQDLLLPPEKLSDPAPLTALLRTFLVDLHEHRNTVAGRLSDIRSMSALNVSALLR